jgi:hypothetical protein
VLETDSALTTGDQSGRGKVMDRRGFLLGGCALSASAMAAGEAAWAGSVTVRPFRWRDAYHRTEVKRIAISADEAQFALETTRPLASGGEYAGPAWGALLDLRGDVWLLDRELKKPRKLNGGTRGVWGTSFSPDSRHLAALTQLSPGRIGFVVWDLPAAKPRILSDVNVELFYASFASAHSRYGGPSGFFQVPKKYEWLDSNSLLVVDHGPTPQQSLLSIGSLSSTTEDLRLRTLSGRVSVRDWTDRSSTCGAGSRLVRVRCDTGACETIYVGDVRGVSLSPDRSSVALLVAVAHIPPRPDAPMDSALLQTGPGDDPMVVLKLVVVDLMRLGHVRDVDTVTTIGCAAPSRLPVWSEDSERIGIPVRSTYSDLSSTGDDAAWEFNVRTGAIRRFRASSALDAALLASLVTTEGLSGESIRNRRPQVNRPGNYSSGGQIRGGAWRCGAMQVMLWNAPDLSIITPTRNITVAGKFASVQPPVSAGAVWRALALQSDGSASMVTTWDDSHEVEDVTVSAGWDFLGVRAGDAAVIWKDDADSGTHLFLAGPGAEPRQSQLSFNTYFRDVSKPTSIVVSRIRVDGTASTGILQLPIGHKSGERHPIIVWAYPDSKPSPEEQIARVNSYISGVYPIQYLLTRGFGFFHAPFPIGGRSSLEPMRAATDAVLAWLDVLDARPQVSPGQYGFFGHSNAGYVALALEALSHRFKAIVAWGTFPEIGFDVLHSDAGNVALNCAGSIIQSNRQFYEDRGQPYIPQPTPPWRDPAAYIRNDPIFNLKSATTPLLLVEGEFDADPREMEAVYSILYARGVPVELAYYWGEGHVLSSPGNIRDSWLRTERFFAKYLRR